MEEKNPINIYSFKENMLTWLWRSYDFLACRICGVSQT